MKDIKIGKWVITRKSIISIITCLFSLGVIIGSAIAQSIDLGKNINWIFVCLFFIPIVLIHYKPITRGIHKEE